MHYTQKLGNRIIKQNELIQEVELELNYILKYLSSDKFAGMENNYVNASEIFNRIMEVRNLINE